MPAISVRVKTRSLSATGGDRRHNERIGKQPDYVDASRTPENSVLLEAPTPAKMSAECLKRRQAAFVPGPGKRQPKSMAKDAAISISGIVTFSSDAYPEIDKLSPDEQDRRFLAAAEAVAERLGTDVAGLAVHRDESNTHAHFTLYGFGKNGEPVSRKMQKKVLSEIQDIAAEPFEDLGITRGKKIGERIKNGEPYSKTVNRSVRELHRDLPIERAAAQEKVADMQKRVEATRAKLEAGTGNLEKLEKRLATYEKRLNDRKAELDRLTEKAKIPKPKKTANKDLVYFTPVQMRDFAGKKQAEIDRSQTRHRKLADTVRTKTKRFQHATREKRDRTESSLEAVGGILVSRYGLMVTETEKRVSVAPQSPASASQIAAALYRSSREKGWEKIHFAVMDNVAEKLIRMAVDDGMADNVTFATPAHNLQLLKAKHEHSRQQAQPKNEKTPATKTTQTDEPDEDDKETISL